MLAPKPGRRSPERRGAKAHLTLVTEADPNFPMENIENPCEIPSIAASIPQNYIRCTLNYAHW